MEKEINIRSDEVNEIFAKIPSNMVQWGNTWIFIILLGLLALAYFVKYPDVITGNIVLASNTAPVTLVSTTNGKISLVKNNFMPITSGERIAFITENTDIKPFDTLYKYLKQHDIETIRLDSIPVEELGKLQSQWSRFIVDFKAYQIYINSQPERIGIHNSQNQIHNNQKSVASLQEQLQLKQEQLDFYKRKMEKDNILLNKGLISEREFQNTLMQYNEMQNQIKSLASQQISIDKNNSDYQKQIADYQITKTQTESQKLTELRQSRITLLEELELWFKTNTFVSPIDGILQYNQSISNNQFILQGTELFTITPQTKQSIECNMTVAMSGMGKVTQGQKVIIRLQHYPDEEYGVIYGKVKEISPSPILTKTAEGAAKMYSIKVSLTDGLNTSYHKVIDYKPNMEGTADIVTKDKSFMHRIFEQLIKLIKRN